MKIYLLFLLSVFLSCGKVEFSPNQKFDTDTPTDLNKKNIARLQSAPKDDTIRFVLTGDTQRAYSACQDMVKKISLLPGVDFTLIDGDISDFGLYQEMEWINDIYAKLNSPYIAILGNHDISANGKAVFQRMYGQPDFSFVYQGIKFVCHDSNSREYDFNGSIPNLSWLRNEMKPEPGVTGYVAVSHVPCFDADFDKNLEKDYTEILLNSGKLLASLNAHINMTEVLYPYDTKTPFIVTDTAAKREFVLIDIIHGKLSYKIIDF